MKKLKVLSLFDGMSCGQIALEGLGYSAKLGNLEYYASEIEQPAITVTQHNYPETIQLGDVTKVSFKDGVLYSENGEFEVGQFDMIIGGSPCQGFSIAGKQLNFEDPRSILFFEYYRIKEEINPKLWFLENVKMKKEYKDIISNFVKEEPVFIDSGLLSAGIRKRFYWYSGSSQNQPSIKDEDKKICDILEKGEKIKHTLMPAEKVEKILFRGVEDIDSPIKNLNPKREDGKLTYQQDRVYHHSGKMVALTASLGNRFYILDDENRIRKLTIREQARIHNVPDSYDFSSVSDLQASSMIGNGWTVGVIKEIFKIMLNEKY